MKYKRFGETRAETIILSEFVEMRWNSKNKKRYVSLGYKYTFMRDDFMCRVEDLPKCSRASIAVRCPVCGDDREISYGDFSKVGHTVCNRCSCTNDLYGMTFGRWRIIDYVDSGNQGAVWLCECECGNTGFVDGKSLVNGDSKSCGCYKMDVYHSQVGDKNPNWKGGPIIRSCEICGEQYEIKRAHISTSRFCSVECRGRWCSENMSRENSPHWKPEKTDEEREIGRKYPGYKKWVNDVLKRDRYTCVVCGEKGGKLEAHHLFNYSDHVDRQLDLENGVTIHKDEHAEFHLDFMGGWAKPCTKRDFEIWLMLKKKK